MVKKKVQTFWAFGTVLVWTGLSSAVVGTFPVPGETGTPETDNKNLNELETSMI